MSINGKAYIVGAYEHPTRKARTRPWRSCMPRSPMARSGCRAEQDDIDGYFCAGAAPGLGPLNMADYLGLTAQAPRQHRYRRLLLCPACRPCGGGDRARQVQRRAGDAGRPAARRGMATGTAPRTWGANAPDDPVRVGLWPRRRRTAMRWRHAATCTNSAPPRAARLDQGRRLPPRPVEPACHAAQGRHRRGCGELADGVRPAAPAGLLRRSRMAAAR